MKTLLNDWSIFRILRLILGVALLVQAVIVKDTATGLLAGFLVVTAFTNTGCCGTGACAMPNKKRYKNDVRSLNEKQQADADQTMER